MAKKTNTTAQTPAEARTVALKSKEFSLKYTINAGLVNSARQCKGVDENGETLYAGPARLADFVARLNTIVYNSDVPVSFAHKLNGHDQIVVITHHGKVAELEYKGVSDFVEQLTSCHQEVVIAMLVKTAHKVFVPVIPKVDIVEEG